MALASKRERLWPHAKDLTVHGAWPIQKVMGEHEEGSVWGESHGMG